MKKISLLLTFVIIATVVYGQLGTVEALPLELQNPETSDITDQKEKEALEWVHAEWAKAKNPKVLESYDGEDFFKRDSIHVVGYIKGYDPRLGFSSVIIYYGDQFTREDFPATVRIYENGTFEASYEALYPEISYISIHNQTINFYAEPGHTIGLLLDWEEILEDDRNGSGGYTRKGRGYTRYLGELGEFNKRLFAIDQHRPDYKQLLDNIKKVAPTEFKNTGLREWKAESLHFDPVLSTANIDAKLSSLIKAQLDMVYATYFFEYANNRAYYYKQDTTNEILKLPISEDYYDFVTALDFIVKLTWCLPIFPFLFRDMSIQSHFASDGHLPIPP